MSSDRSHSTSDQRDIALIEEAWAQTHRTRDVLAREAALPPPCTVPGYTIAREIRRGGQGVVYEATQHATGRRVAIKMLREGSLAGRVEQSRFKIEVAVLAQFQHPHIVRLYDGGSIDGRPYYVMDYVEGQPLDSYLRGSRHKPQDVLRLVQTIASAVQAAHLKGIVHRDLKPTNIRVDESGDPHVLDFGLAKLTGRDDWLDPHDHSLTLTGQFTGSLPWAAPEQVESTSGEVDVRTDVYALGVILFQALTGRFPYDVRGSARSVMDNILTTDPMRPSRLSATLDYDIDSIVLKCLNKNSERRYQSAGELARDIELYLNGEPIEAKRDSTLYVLSKTIRRYRGAAAAVAVVGALTLVYSATMTILYRQARTAEAEAQAATHQSDKNFEQARRTNLRMIDRILHWETLTGTAALRRELIPAAYEGLSDLLADRPTDPEGLIGYATALCKMGDFAAELSQFDDAVSHYREAVSIREALVKRQPSDLKLRTELSVAVVKVGDVLGKLNDRVGRRAHHERALTMDRELVEMDPENAHFWDNLSWSYGRLAISARDEHHPKDAALLEAQQLEAAQRAVELDPDNPVRHNTLLEARLRQVRSLVRGASLRDAEIHLEAAKNRLRFDPNNRQWEEQFEAAQARIDSVRANSRAGLPHLRSAAETAQLVVSLAPDNPQYRRRLIWTLRDLAYQAEQAGESGEAAETIAHAISTAEQLTQNDPGVPENLELLAALHLWAMDRAARREDFITASVEAAAAVQLLARTLADAPDSGRLAHQLFLARHAHATYLSKLDLEPDAREQLVAAIDLAERSLAEGRMTPESLMDFGVILTQPESLDFRDIDRGLELMRQTITTSCPDDALRWERLANAAASAGRMDFACSAYQVALKFDRSLSP